jgi:hypothetical protein
MGIRLRIDTERFYRERGQLGNSLFRLENFIGRVRQPNVKEAGTTAFPMAASHPQHDS